MASERKRDLALTGDQCHQQPLQGPRLRPIHPSWFALRHAASAKALDPVG